VREWDTKAGRIIRSQGNLAGRGRLRSDLSDRPAFPPRGMILSTGEQHPTGESVLARTIVIELGREDIDMDQLTSAQEQVGELPHALAGYVQFLARRADGLEIRLARAFEEARSRARLGDAHLRAPEAVAHLWIGIDLALEFAEEVGACSRRRANRLRRLCWKTLMAVMRAQGEVVREEQPTHRYLLVLRTLLAQRDLLLLPRDVPGGVLGEVSGRARLVGWFDKKYVYLLPEAAHAAVTRFCRDAGEPFPISGYRVRKNLHQEGVSEPDSKRLTATVNVGGQTRRVLKLRREAVDKVVGEQFVTRDGFGVA
jgi:hypothetical protein